VKISKDFIKYIVIGVLIVLVGLLVFKSCTLTSRYSTLVGEYNALDGVHKRFEQEATTAILKAREYIFGLRAQNEAIARQVKLTEKQLVNKDVKLIQLNKELVEAQNTGDKDAQISNLLSQVNIWKEKFTLAEKIIADKDTVIFNLKQQYEKQVVITVDLEGLYESSQDLLRRNETLFKITQRKLRTAKAGGTLKSVALGVLGGLVAYKIIK